MKRIWANLEEIIISFFLFVMVGVISVNVILRLTVHLSFSWLEEVSYFCFGGFFKLCVNLLSGVE